MKPREPKSANNEKNRWYVGGLHFECMQCRTWPFWPENLASADSWNRAAIKCAGINRGKLHTFEKIEALRKQKRWWADAD